MLQKMSNLDYHFVAEELKGIEGARLNKIYELTPGVLRFKFTKEGNDFHLLAELGVRMHLTYRLEEAPKTPTSFVMYLRKNLENARLVGVEQLNFDRLVALRLQKEKDFLLVFEMFAKGNVLLCDGDYKILQPYRKEEKSGRLLQAGQKLELPPKTKIIPAELALGDLETLEGGAAKALAEAVSLAPLYIKNALAIAGVEENAEISALPEEKKRATLHEIQKLAAGASPTVYYNESGTPTAFCCVELAKPPGAAKKFETISKALDEYYSNASAVQTAAEKEKSKGAGGAVEKELEKLERSLAMQKSSLVQVEKEAGELKAKGDAVYANFEKAGELIAEARKKTEKKAILEAA
ncbi:MAG: NFACT family protein [Candidatus Micrarchaeia archaeon]